MRVAPYGSEPRKTTIADMEDGDMAVIVKWKYHEYTEGRIVQRYYDSLIILGERGEAGFSGFFEEPSSPAKEKIIIRKVRPGETLICNN